MNDDWRMKEPREFDKDDLQTLTPGKQIDGVLDLSEGFDFQAGTKYRLTYYISDLKNRKLAVSEPLEFTVN